MNTTPRTSRLRPLVTGGAIAVAALAGTTFFMPSAMTQPDNTVHELPMQPLPSEAETTHHVIPNAFIDLGCVKFFGQFARGFSSSLLGRLG